MKKNVKISVNNAEIYKELKNFEKRILDLETALEPLKLICQAAKEKFSDEYKTNPSKLHFHEFLKFKIFEDKTLNHTEKKLAEFLCDKYDPFNHMFIALSHAQIRKQAHISTSILSKVLKSLTEKKILLKEHKGNMCLYRINALAYKKSDNDV
ncbi:hypothetical protein KY347_04070 [Candidatus Woesearchaeota archaeon]|nr:hypothetical protein [Candidatus Woesearchaeota archaeon]